MVMSVFQISRGGRGAGVSLCIDDQALEGFFDIAFGVTAGSLVFSNILLKSGIETFSKPTEFVPIVRLEPGLRLFPFGLCMLP